MWSWHFFMGLQLGVEWYANDDKDYFIIDLLCVRDILKLKHLDFKVDKTFLLL